MNIKPLILSLLLTLGPCRLSAQDFLSTSGFRFTEKKEGCSFSAQIDFPVEGSPKAVKAVKEWLCDLLEVDLPSQLDEGDFEDLLRQSAAGFREGRQQATRRIEVERTYEDEVVVTYVARITDKDSVTMKDEDCASFSKRDGHRIVASEMFKCKEAKVKELMWRYRGDLEPAVTKPEHLLVGNVAYIDGWILAVGPAEGYTGAIYRIRYEAAEPYLKKSRSGGYY